MDVSSIDCHSWNVGEDFSSSLYRFLLGLALFLADEEEEAAILLESAGKPRDWFQVCDWGVAWVLCI